MHGAEGECREFELMVEGRPVACFAVYHRGRYYGYRNRCPHRGLPLNWQPEQFLTVEQDMIQCALHGALFRIDDGHCVYGPCVGLALESVPLDESGRVTGGMGNTYDEKVGSLSMGEANDNDKG